MRWTRINSNGSKMYGGPPDDLGALLKDLARYPLNRTFERIFIPDLGNGVKRLMEAILANRTMPAFKSQPSAKKQIRAIRKWLDSR